MNRGIASCETIEQLEHLIHIVYDRVQNEKVQSNLIELIHRKEKSLADGKRDINSKKQRYANSLKKMSLVNFKGIAVRNSILILLLILRSRRQCDRENNNNECLLWCLFGKDIEDRKDFEIKPMIKKVKSLKVFEHSVELVLDVDSKRNYSEKEFFQKNGKKRVLMTLSSQGNENYILLGMKFH